MSTSSVEEVVVPEKASRMKLSTTERTIVEQARAIERLRAKVEKHQQIVKDTEAEIKQAQGALADALTKGLNVVVVG